jgi:branched-chain amino acid transport system permease protein
MVSGAILAGLGASGGLFAQLLSVSGVVAYEEVIAGFLLLLTLQLHPDGIASTRHALQQRFGRRRRPGPSEPAEPAAPPPRAGETPVPAATAPARTEGVR